MRGFSSHSSRAHQITLADSCLLLLPNTLEKFILRELAQDLLRAETVIAIEPATLSYGALARIPGTIRHLLANAMARRIYKRTRRKVKVIVLFHPIQWPLAQALLAQHPTAELWYSRWDRYEDAYDATPAQKKRLQNWHQAITERADLIFCVSQKLVELESDAKEKTILVPLTAEEFPTQDPTETITAVCLGHLGWRIDWQLLQTVCERMPNLTLLLIGESHPKECQDDPAFTACQKLANILWLGKQGNNEAARLILCADVGLLPFKEEPFNDAGLPYRILKYARLGRRTISTNLQGAKTWSYAVDFASDAEEFIALLKQAKQRQTQAAALRSWALTQTPMQQHQILWERLMDLELAKLELPNDKEPMQAKPA